MLACLEYKYNAMVWGKVFIDTNRGHFLIGLFHYFVHKQVFSKPVYTNVMYS